MEFRNICLVDLQMLCYDGLVKCLRLHDCGGAGMAIYNVIIYKNAEVGDE